MSQTIVSAHCNTCLGQRNHFVVHHEHGPWEEDPHCGVGGKIDYELLRCCGCEEVKMRRTTFCSEDVDHEENELIPSFSYFPPAQSAKMPDWVHHSDVPGFVTRILEQVYSAIFIEAYDLASMGLRAVFEHSMIEKIGDKGAHVTNLQAFLDAGYVSSKQKEMLSETINLGNATNHRDFECDRGDVLAALGIIESIMALVYFHPAQAEKLRQRVPPKPQKPAKNNKIV